MPYNPVMPLYEFMCASCGERFEIISSDAERDENAVCPSCGGRDVSQVFGGSDKHVETAAGQEQALNSALGRLKQYINQMRS